MQDSNYIVGLDIGYGDTKVTIGHGNGEPLKMFKFPSCIAKTIPVSVIRDPRIIQLDGEYFYIGQDALSLPSTDIVDITEYENLEKFAPLFIYQALKLADIDQDQVKVLVSGLSVSQLSQSGYFKERISNFEVNNKSYKFEQVFLLPQGAGSKLAFDKYSDHYPQARTEEQNSLTFIGCDIGFNTLDVFYVANGKTSPNLFEGLSHEGVTKVAAMVCDAIRKDYQREITISEAKGILDCGFYKLRGESYDMTQQIQQAKEIYIKQLIDLVEQKYSSIIDKCDFICLLGGGACYFENQQHNYIRAVKNKAEFYNSLGFYLFGCTKAKK